MNENKWIKLHSKLLNWGWYKNKNTKILFIHCLLKANWKDGIFEGVSIMRGSFATSIQSLMKELDMSKQEVRTALKHLISTQEITQTQYPKFTVISITNYELYQQVNTPLNTGATQEQHSSNTGATPIEDYIEYKNIEDITSSINNKYARDVFPFETEKLEAWINHLSADLVGYAIDISVANGVKRLDYVEGILRNWLSAGYKTRQEVILDQKKKEEKEPVELFDYDWLNENE